VDNYKLCKDKTGNGHVFLKKERLPALLTVRATRKFFFCKNLCNSHYRILCQLFIPLKNLLIIPSSCLPLFLNPYLQYKQAGNVSCYFIQMLLIQMTGLSGAGKSSIAHIARETLTGLGYKVELLDGDDYRQHLCHDLGFSKADRIENIRRLGFVGLMLAKHGVISILAAINPYEEARDALKRASPLTKTVFIDCPLSVTKQRDPKGLYRRALLPIEDPDYIEHFTGISDPYEVPDQSDLVIQTHSETPEQSAKHLTDFIIQTIREQPDNIVH
jgi:adenylylsulfate kinase